MYHLLLGVQYIGIILLVLLILYVANQKPSSRQQLVLGITVALLINFIGYLFEMRATNKEMALQAVKFIYFGKPYVILFMFAFQMEICKMPIRKWRFNVLLLIHIFVTALVLTCEHNTLFYSSIEFVDNGFFPHLKLGHGSIYWLYHAFIISYILVVMVVAIRRYLNVRTKDERQQIRHILLIDIIMLIGFAAFSLGLTNGYDATLVAYLISLFVLCDVLFRYKLLDAVMVAKDVAIDELSDGLMVLDNERRPVFTNYKADQILSGSDVYTMQELIAVVDDHILDGTNYVAHNREYQVSSRILSQNNEICGKMYLLRDVTEIERRTKEIISQSRMMSSLRNEAQKIAETRSVLSKTASSEIRRVLKDIFGFMDVFFGADDNAGQPQIVEEFYDSVKSIERILDDVYELNKSQTSVTKLMEEQGGYISDYVSKDIETLAQTMETEDGVVWNICASESRAGQQEEVPFEEETLTLSMEQSKEEKAAADQPLVTIETAGEKDIYALKGIDTEKGLVYCGGKEMLEMIIGEFYRSIDENIQKIETYVAQKNLNDYTIRVHGIKSNSRMIGAMNLAAWFEKMEKCGHAGDFATIQAETPMLLDLYRTYKTILAPFAEVGFDE